MHRKKQRVRFSVLKQTEKRKQKKKQLLIIVNKVFYNNTRVEVIN